VHLTNISDCYQHWRRSLGCQVLSEIGFTSPTERSIFQRTKHSAAGISQLPVEQVCVTKEVLLLLLPSVVSAIFAHMWFSRVLRQVGIIDQPQTRGWGSGVEGCTKFEPILQLRVRCETQNFERSQVATKQKREQERWRGEVVRKGGSITKKKERTTLKTWFPKHVFIQAKIDSFLGRRKPRIVQTFVKIVQPYSGVKTVALRFIWIFASSSSSCA